MTVEFYICVAGEEAAGLRGFTDTVSVTVQSGDPGGEKGEFIEHMRQALAEWYDGGKVTLI